MQFSLYVCLSDRLSGLASTSVCLTDSVLVCQSCRESVSPPHQSLSVHHRVCQSTTESVCLPQSLFVHHRVCQSTTESVSPPQSLSVHHRVCLSTRESVSFFFSTLQSFNLFCLSVLHSLKYSLMNIFLPG